MYGIMVLGFKETMFLFLKHRCCLDKRHSFRFGIHQNIALTKGLYRVSTSNPKIIWCLGKKYKKYSKK